MWYNNINEVREGSTVYTFIINPNSRSGQGNYIWKEIELIIKKKAIKYNALFTKYQGHATTLVEQLVCDNRLHTIIVLGGDGTINEVVNGIDDYSKVILGYIPIGSSNDFARGLGLPFKYIEALETILSAKHFQTIDIGVLRYSNHKKRNFAVSTGIGFDAAICHQAMVSKLKIILNHLKLGKLTYAGIAFNQLAISKPKKMTLVLDGYQTYHFEAAYFATVMNTPYEGGGFKFCPEANPSDGLLNVIVVDSISKAKALSLLPFAISGNHVSFKGVHTYTCKTVEIQSEKALPVHTDGEPVFLQRTISATIASSKLRIITTK